MYSKNPIKISTTVFCRHVLTICLIYDTLISVEVMKYRVFRTEEFNDWLKSESFKSQVQIEKRISNIEIDGHFGDINDVGDCVLELKWKNGRRVYYAYLAKAQILLLLGGNKNGQSYDISQAKKILGECTESE